MTVVNMERVSNNYGVRLYKDASLISEIELAEFITPTTTVFKAPTLKGIRVAEVYELVTGSWVKRTDVRISGDNILLDSVPAGQLIIIPKTAINLVQAGTKASAPKQLFVKTFAEFITENFTITSLDTETAAPGPLEFSLTETGTYTAALGPIAVPASIWVKSTTSLIGAVKTIPIITTADIYL
jgi:hypothetical protein